MQNRDLIFETLPYNPSNDPSLGYDQQTISNLTGIETGTVSNRLWTMKSFGYEIDYKKSRKGNRTWWRLIPLFRNEEKVPLPRDNLRAPPYRGEAVSLPGDKLKSKGKQTAEQRYIRKMVNYPSPEGRGL